MKRLLRGQVGMRVLDYKVRSYSLSDLCVLSIARCFYRTRYPPQSFKHRESPILGIS